MITLSVRALLIIKIKIKMQTSAGGSKRNKKDRSEAGSKLQGFEAVMDDMSSIHGSDDGYSNSKGRIEEGSSKRMASNKYSNATGNVKDKSQSKASYALMRGEISNINPEKSQ